MDTYKQFKAWLWSILVLIVSFFLYMFYMKVQEIGDNVNTLLIDKAVKDEKNKGMENRVENLERRVTFLESK